MNNLSIILTTLFLTMLAILQTKAMTNPYINDVFSGIHNISETVLTRLERHTANKQEYLLSVALGFTLIECILLITSLILHVVSITVLKRSRIIAS